MLRLPLTFFRHQVNRAGTPKSTPYQQRLVKSRMDASFRARVAAATFAGRDVHATRPASAATFKVRAAWLGAIVSRVRLTLAVQETSVRPATTSSRRSRTIKKGVPLQFKPNPEFGRPYLADAGWTSPGPAYFPAKFAFSPHKVRNSIA